MQSQTKQKNLLGPFRCHNTAVSVDAWPLLDNTNSQPLFTQQCN